MKQPSSINNFPCKLSIVTVCYNEPNLRATCESIVNQIWQDFEWIVIDGGSNKKTIDVFDEYKHRMNYFVSEKDNGIYNAMNKGIAKSKGEYICFLNAGDNYIDNRVLQNVIKKGLDRDIIFGDECVVKKGKIKKIRYPNKIDFAYLYRESLPHQSSFIKRELFERYGNYDEQYKIVSDWKKWLDFLVLNKCSYKHINLVCSKFDNSGISSKNNELREKEHAQVLQEYFSNLQLQEIENKTAKKTKELSFREKIFSIKTTYDKKHKVITLIGLKIIIKRRVS